ncbi:MAG: hypothetical protein KJO79_09365, partial [Verrucomicrobiae bacterium]|nr:hypothetical protein [Verrucomicrobiae bacterium]NNJ87377.1 hypothetical protein [Akkermansiaceae bacterium]
RDDTFRIRAYGESRDSKDQVLARAWCEAIVQRTPEYTDPSNENHEGFRTLQTDGSYADNPALRNINRRFGRKFHMIDFRWLTPDEI